jgi:hypothetical protein
MTGDNEMDKTMQVLMHGYCLRRCGGIAQSPHTCPFSTEIHNDYTLCNCCEDCERNCADDI